MIGILSVISLFTAKNMSEYFLLMLIPEFWPGYCTEMYQKIF